MEPPANPTIMIVDDTAENLRVLQDMLHTEGFRVTTFPRGKLAITAARRQPPDLVLLDIMMPEMDGFSVCRALKAEETLSEIPVIFLSAVTDPEMKIKGFSEGGVDYITKPFFVEEVLARVRTHLLIRNQNRDLQDAYEKLRILEEQRNEFVQMTVHDLRSPLTVVYSILSSLSRSEIPDNKIPAMVTEGIRATRRIIDLVSLVLDVNRLESGSLQLQRSVIDLRALVEQGLINVRPALDERTLTGDLPERPIEVLCDQSLIARVLSNILDNAITHTDSNTGEITVSARCATDPSSGNVYIGVRDNGPGIPEEHHQEIFEKYGQVHARKNSSGLGLTFCKLVINAHGGEIGVESTSGKGSTFWFTLPAYESTSDAPDPPSLIN